MMNRKMTFSYRTVIFLCLMMVSGVSAFTSSLMWEKRSDFEDYFYHTFQVKTLILEVNGRSGEEEHDLQRYLQHQTSHINGRLIWHVDGMALYQRLLSHPLITKVDVVRRWPDRISVDVTVPQIFATWRDSQEVQAHMLGWEGNTIAVFDDFAPHRALPMITGGKAESYRLIRLLRAYPTFWKALARAVHVEDRRWDLYLGGMLVQLPQEGLEESLVRLSSLYRPSMGFYLKKVDLRIFGRVAVVLRSEVQQKFLDML